MTCIQGFVCAVPTANRDAFINYARMAAEAFRDYGLVGAWECWGDDVPEGEVTSFPMAVKAGDDETVVFAWYRWPSQAVLEEAMGKIHDDPRLSPEGNPMPFDAKRVIYGSFDPLLEIGRPQPGGYFDGYLMAVPRDRRETFREFAEFCDPVFAEHGANWVMETWGVDIPDGEHTDFRCAVKAGPDEQVVFSWVQWPDKAARDAGWQKVMDDKRFADLTMPFDGKRMVYGGFIPVVANWQG